MFPIASTDAIKTTSYKIVLPFYIYAAVWFLIAAVMMFVRAEAFMNHFFHPHLLAITHIMALGWATMVILGAAHQLVPVLIEGKLHSDRLAYATFILAALGIPLLVYGFYHFEMHAPAKWGGRFVILAVLCFLINIYKSMAKSKSENVHAVFVFTAILWLFATVAFGLALVYNFTYTMFPHDYLHYLPLHAHTGIIGWFLLLVIGVGSRLIPMFMISKYTNPKLLWIIYLLINGALVIYLIIFYFFNKPGITMVPSLLIMSAVVLFIKYCYHAYKERLRKTVDEQIKISLLSVAMLLIPMIMLVILIGVFMTSASEKEKLSLVICYGFVIFFGWLTAIILGMTFKTLPFIVWNKVYHLQSAKGRTPNPKDLFSDVIFRIMSISYLAGFVIFGSGILSEKSILLQSGATLLIVAAFFYNWNVVKVITHKASIPS